MITIAIECIVRVQWRKSLLAEKIKSKVSVHCSCGYDYTVKELFNLNGGHEVRYCDVRTAFCPSCNESDRLAHTVIRRFNHCQGDYYYSVKLDRPEGL